MNQSVNRSRNHTRSRARVVHWGKGREGKGREEDDALRASFVVTFVTRGPVDESSHVVAGALGGSVIEG